jgi:polyisoprenoid-binding protein YceI
MTTRPDRSEPGVTSTDRSPPDPRGTWAIDPATSIVSYARRTLRLGTITGRLHSVGVIHLDELPPVGVIRLQQPSGLPVLTIALDPASIQTHSAELAGSDVGAVSKQRWWTLRSESLELLSCGSWRVMATLTANGTPGLVELHLEIEPAPGDADGLVLRGGGVLDRAAFGAKRASILGPQVLLELAVRARKLSRSPWRLLHNLGHPVTVPGPGWDIRPRTAGQQGVTHDPRPFGRSRTEGTRPPASALGPLLRREHPSQGPCFRGAARDPRRGRRHQAHPIASHAVTEESAPNTSRETA